MSKRKRKETAATAEAAGSPLNGVSQALKDLAFRRPDLERDLFRVARDNGLRGVTSYIQTMRRYRKLAQAVEPKAQASSGSGQ